MITFLFFFFFNLCKGCVFASVYLLVKKNSSGFEQIFRNEIVLFFFFRKCWSLEKE